MNPMHTHSSAGNACSHSRTASFRHGPVEGCPADSGCEAQAIVAIMQPYVFPYSGYFSLLFSCRDFVFCDDVNFMKNGWVNRNRILVNGQEYMFTVPLKRQSQNELICDILPHDFVKFRERFLKTLAVAYKKASNFEFGYHYVSEVLHADFSSIAELGIHSVQKASVMLGLDRNFLVTSSDFPALRGSERCERIITITRSLKSRDYVNAIGGKEIYSKERFAADGVNLSFCEPALPPYRQHGTEQFVAGLSIIDLFMNNSASEILRLIGSYELT